MRQCEQSDEVLFQSSGYSSPTQRPTPSRGWRAQRPGRIDSPAGQAQNAFTLFTAGQRRCATGVILARAKHLATATVVLLLLVGGNTAGAQTLRIYHVDVEQGDATLFVTPSGKTLLVDSGKNGHGKRLKAVMDTAGVSQIDAFVATHYHEDHYGGIDDLVKMGIPVLAAFDRGDKECCLPAAKKKEVTFRGYQQAVGQNATHLQRGMRIDLDPLVTVTCISSGGVVIGEAPPVPGHEENDMSVSLLVTFGAFRYFVGGDIEAATEAKLAARDLVTAVDVYQANHHGSHSSSSAEFMADISLTVVVVSNGSVEKYRHPRAITLQTYGAIPGPPVVFQTNKCFHPEPCANVPDQFIADLKPSSTAGTILISVDGASSTYTVTYGTQSRQFKTKALPPVLPIRTVIIDSLLPDPVGSDEQLEEGDPEKRGHPASVARRMDTT